MSHRDTYYLALISEHLFDSPEGEFWVRHRLAHDASYLNSRGTLVTLHDFMGAEVVRQVATALGVLYRGYSADGLIYRSARGVLDEWAPGPAEPAGLAPELSAALENLRLVQRILCPDKVTRAVDWVGGLVYGTAQEIRPAGNLQLVLSRFNIPSVTWNYYPK